jgi:putative transposase
MLGLARSSVYYEPRPVPEIDLALMGRIDELHLQRPFLGARMLRLYLQRDGYVVGRRHVGTLMRRMSSRSMSP